MISLIVEEMVIRREAKVIGCRREENGLRPLPSYRTSIDGIRLSVRCGPTEGLKAAIAG